MAFLGIGSVFGGMQVSLAAFTEAIGEPGLNGVLYGVFAAGNMLAGIACGAIAWKRGPRRRLVARLRRRSTLAASAPVDGALRARCWRALGLLVGLCIAPALITGYTLVECWCRPRARTEAFTWLTGAVALGQAAAVDGRPDSWRTARRERRIPGAAGRHRAGAGHPAGAAFAAGSPRAPRADRGAWRSVTACR